MSLVKGGEKSKGGVRVEGVGPSGGRDLSEGRGPIEGRWSEWRG